ncbi:nitrogen regulation protein NR(II) [Pseudidiomarina woesei]|uniref:Sensory histidine kinase/phosphatase NtrB n=1 Tax=Pseudidiomarina woesei TaxID=1381080 RepID=A0A0K6H4W0_9GAMM|nr:nitrogen regulation protein NR(II) [Pseudidiomarina woesei]CUA85941.1 Signal transduction histidine kinase, nitrogen specific [Pseudidiomarina woesei]
MQPNLDQLLTAVVLLDDQLRIRSMNAAAEAILDGSLRRFQLQPFFSLFHFSSLDPLVIQHALYDEQSVSDSDVTLILHDGQRITIEFIAQPLRQADGSLSILLELRQIDQIRRINQENNQQQQLHAAQSMVRGLAHEIKNPLGGLRGAAQLLASELVDPSLKFPDPSLKEYTDLIIRQADRLSLLVDRLLGSHELPKRKLSNIHELLEHVIDVVRLGVGPSIDWVRDYDPSLPELNMAAEQMEQVLLNLVMNACDAMLENQTKQPQITVRTRIALQQTIHGKRYRHCAVVTVQDNGPGIADTIRDTLFYPMVSGRAGGTGLGLSIAQNLVHQHGGKIEVRSEPGHTEFNVYLPYSDTICHTPGQVTERSLS